MRIIGLLFVMLLAFATVYSLALMVSDAHYIGAVIVSMSLLAIATGGLLK